MFKLSIQVNVPNLDRFETSIPCPKCHLETQVSLGQIRRREYVVCRGCYINIHLIDHMGSIHRVQKKISHMLKKMER